VIPVISGTAGIGKTALAVHWAHQVADRFPDGQLYVDLRGFDPTGTAMDIAEAVRGFLEAFGVPSDRIPVGRDAQLALYRTLSADRRMLVLLDNARDVDDVRPLLPVSPTAVAIVTSRSRQDSLVAVEGAEPITLDLLTTAQAQQLLARRLGHNRIAAEPPAVDEIIRQCSGLPLALTIVAVRAAAHPRFPLAVLASELGDPTTRLDVLDTGDPTTNARGVFSWSYRRLSAAAARLFRLLGVHHGPDVTAAAAASLAGLPLADTRRLLAELTRTHLLTEHAPRRYSFHDLLRAYAAEQAHAHDSEPERRAALHRVFDYYLHTAHGAARWLDPHRDPITLPAGEPGTQPTIIADAAQAVAWFTAERQVLLAVIDQAVGTGFDAHAWRLAWATARFLERHGHWEQWAASQQVAVDAARREADRLGQAVAHRLAGRAHMRLGRHDAAYAHLRRSMDHYRALGDDNGRAGVEVCLAQVCERQGRYRDALGHAREALDVHRASERRAGEAVTRNMVGWFHAHLGEYEQALADCRGALTVAL
jgi:tetratricopeptide (TPR) repeat protein